MNKTFYRNLRIGYGMSLAILAVVGFMSYRTLISLIENNKAVAHGNLVMQKLEKALSLMKDAETGQRGFLLTGKQHYLEPYRGASRRALDLVDEVDKLSSDYPEQQRNIALIQRIMRERMTILQIFVTGKLAGKETDQLALDKGKAAMDALREAISKAEAFEQRLLDQRAESLSRLENFTPVVFMIAIILGLLTAVFSYIRARNDFQKQEHLINELNAQKEEIAALNEELTAANEEVTAANEELVEINSEILESREELATANESLEQRVEERTMALRESEEKTQALNEELTAINEELAATNEELMATNEELAESQQELQRSLAELKAGEERNAKLVAIVESSDDAIIGKNLDGIITSWNRGAEQIFGFTEAEIVGQSILTLIPDDLQHEEAGILSRLRNGEKIDHYETIRRSRDGRLIDVSLTISPIRDGEGHVTGVSKIARDITDQKRNEQRKTDFIGIASHELKTPLTSISALTQILSKKLANNEDTFIPSAIEKVNFQLRKMIGMINSFLNVSRLESGKLYIEKTDFKLSELIKEEIDEAKLTTGTHTITLVKGPEMVINADRARLGSVISNFLSNAIKYSPDGKTIVVGFEPRETEVMVYVKDEGMGVRAADLDKIFGQYYRVDIAETRQISGFGIGLYLSSEIIRRHQGKIWVESEPGKGAKFCFTLPI